MSALFSTGPGNGYVYWFMFVLWRSWHCRASMRIIHFEKRRVALSRSLYNNTRIIKFVTADSQAHGRRKFERHKDPTKANHERVDVDVIKGKWYFWNSTTGTIYKLNVSRFVLTHTQSFQPNVPSNVVQHCFSRTHIEVLGTTWTWQSWRGSLQSISSLVW